MQCVKLRFKQGNYCRCFSISFYSSLFTSFFSEDSYQTDIKIDDESVKAEVIDTAGNVSRDDGISDKFLVMTLS